MRDAIAGISIERPAARLRRPHQVRPDRAERERNRDRDAGPEGAGRAGLPKAVPDRRPGLPGLSASDVGLIRDRPLPRRRCPTAPSRAESRRGPLPGAAPARRLVGRSCGRVGLHGRGRDSGLVTQSLVTGLLLGGVYALVSIGLTLIFGVLGHRQLRPGLHAHPRNVPGLRAFERPSGARLRRHGHRHPGDVRVRLAGPDGLTQQVDDVRQRERPVAHHARAVPADHQRAVDGLRRPAALGSGTLEGPGGSSVRSRRTSG